LIPSTQAHRHGERGQRHRLRIELAEERQAKAGALGRGLRRANDRSDLVLGDARAKPHHHALAHHEGGDARARDAEPRHGGLKARPARRVLPHLDQLEGEPRLGARERLDERPRLFAVGTAHPPRTW
jgi:hypothetical protein